MKKFLPATVAIAALVFSAPFAHASCQLKGRIHAHIEANEKSPVFDEVISGEVFNFMRIEKKGWMYVDVRKDFKDMNDALFKNVDGWAIVHGGWVRSNQVECLE